MKAGVSQNKWLFAFQIIWPQSSEAMQSRAQQTSNTFCWPPWPPWPPACAINIAANHRGGDQCLGSTHRTGAHHGWLCGFEQSERHFPHCHTILEEARKSDQQRINPRHIKIVPGGGIAPDGTEPCPSRLSFLRGSDSSDHSGIHELGVTSAHPYQEKKI